MLNALGCTHAAKRARARHTLTLQKHAPFALQLAALPPSAQAQAIRDHAGLPPGEQAGIQSGVTCGLIDDTILTSASKLAFNTEGNILSIAASGSGTQNDPYIIENRDYNGGSATNWAHRFNNANSSYHVKFYNCRFYNWTAQCIWLDQAGDGAITFEQCEFYNTVTNAELITHEQGNLNLINCLFSGCNSFTGLVATNTATRSLTIRNLLITDTQQSWPSGSDVIYCANDTVTLDAAYIESETSITYNGADAVF